MIVDNDQAIKIINIVWKSIHRMQLDGIWSVVWCLVNRLGFYLPSNNDNIEHPEWRVWDAASVCLYGPFINYKLNWAHVFQCCYVFIGTCFGGWQESIHLLNKCRLLLCTTKTIPPSVSFYKYMHWPNLITAIRLLVRSVGRLYGNIFQLSRSLTNDPLSFAGKYSLLFFYRYTKKWHNKCSGSFSLLILHSQWITFDPLLFHTWINFSLQSFFCFYAL